MTARSTVRRLTPAPMIQEDSTRLTDHDLTDHEITDHELAGVDLPGLDLRDPGVTDDQQSTSSLPAEIAADEVGAPTGGAEPSFRVITRSEAGARVLDCSGRLDATSLPACASALAACLPVRPPWIVADLRHVEIGRDSLAVLSLMRRYVERGGAQFALVATDPGLLRVLRDANVAGLYRIGSTVLLAISAPGPPIRRRRTSTS